jgi:predicted transcriptional regulator
VEINFACRRFPVEQVLRCSFGLSNAEYRVLRLLLASGELSVEELAGKLAKDRTTVQRTAAFLVRKGLVRRRQYNLEKGGYQYYYNAQDRERIKARVQEQFDRFTRVVREEIERW